MVCSTPLEHFVSRLLLKQMAKIDTENQEGDDHRTHEAEHVREGGRRQRHRRDHLSGHRQEDRCREHRRRHDDCGDDGCDCECLRAVGKVEPICWKTLCPKWGKREIPDAI